MCTLRTIVSCIVLLLSPTCIFADEFSKKRINILFGAGFVISDEYHDVLEESLDLEYGGIGWATLHLGASWRMTARWRLRPSFEYLISQGQSEFGESTVTNSVLLTKLAISCSLNSTGGVYILGEVFSSSADSELPELKFESSGRGAGLFIGFRTKQVGVELGIQHIPVGVSSIHAGHTSRDFGGLAVRVVTML